VELAKEETVEEEAKTLQIIPINATPTIQTTKGYSGSYKGSTNQGSLNNHSNQMNPNNAANNAPKK
jgi:hypothetical protein